MKLWGKRKAAVAQSTFAPALVQDDNRTVVFGVDWSPLIGSRAESAARKKAAGVKATHYVLVSNSGQTGLGTVKLGRSDMKHVGKRKLYPAAAAMALFRPTSTAVGFFELDDGRIWLVKVQNGMVQRGGDLVYQDQDMAWARLHQLQTDAQEDTHGGPAWAFYSNVEVEGSEHLTLEELLNVEIAPLEPRKFSFDQLPKPVRVCFWLSMGIVVAHIGYDAYQSWAKERELEKLRANMQDPQQAWDRAVQEEAALKRWDRSSTVEALYEQVSVVPLDIDGWALVKFWCVPSGQKWSCSATYKRSAYGTTNDRFEAAIPRSWKASFDPFLQATANWSFDGAGGPVGLRPADLPRVDQIYRKPVSQLQEVLPAFKSIRLASAKPWGIQTPLDGNGKPISKPSNFTVPGAVQLVLEGPLRSLSVWDVELTKAAITRLDVERIDAAPGLDSSNLKMKMEGDLYVQNAK
jgi:hypothetical protein